MALAGLVSPHQHAPGRELECSLTNLRLSDYLSLGRRRRSSSKKFNRMVAWTVFGSSLPDSGGPSTKKRRSSGAISGPGQKQFGQCSGAKVGRRSLTWPPPPFDIGDAVNRAASRMPDYGPTSPELLEMRPLNKLYRSGGRGSRRRCPQI